MDDDLAVAAYAAEAEMLELLAELGSARAADERRGGALWAEFGDWCWAMELACTAEAVELFAADRSAGLSTGQLERLRALTVEEGR